MSGSEFVPMNCCDPDEWEAFDDNSEENENDWL